MGKEAKTPDEIVGLNLRDLRYAAGLPQEAIAEAMDRMGFAWHRQTVGQVENGERAVRIGEVVALAAYFEVPLFSILVSPSSLIPFLKVKVGGRTITRDQWAALVLNERGDPRQPPGERIMEPASREVQRAADALIPSKVHRPWAAIWRKGGNAPDAYEAARESVWTRYARRPRPNYVTAGDEEVSVRSVRSRWGQTFTFTIRPGEPYQPRDDAEADVLKQLEERGAVERVTRQRAYRLRQARKEQGR